MAKKALHDQKQAFLFERGGRVYPEEMCIEEIVLAINRGIKGEWGGTTPMAVVLQELHDWICRYIEEGATEDFLNELNEDLRHVRYSNYVVPADFYSSEGKELQSVYIADHNIQYTPDIIAAKEFSRIVTTGKLNRIRRCQLSGCENIFLGPPQAKWCSKSCGSKYRVSEKRKRDSMR